MTVRVDEPGKEDLAVKTHDFLPVQRGQFGLRPDLRDCSAGNPDGAVSDRRRAHGQDYGGVDEHVVLNNALRSVQGQSLVAVRKCERFLGRVYVRECARDARSAEPLQK